MGRPDETDRCQRGIGEEPAEKYRQERQGISVEDVIDDGTRAVID